MIEEKKKSGKIEIIFGVFHDFKVFGFQYFSQNSLYNTEEMNVVLEYIHELLTHTYNGAKLSEADIGVTSPYKLQCTVISRACRRNKYNNITVGTAETFQGQEKPVMIVSTVRTAGQLGFVNDPRVRFYTVIQIICNVKLF